MTSRDRVMKVFAHEIPDRVPRWCGASSQFMDKAMNHLGLSTHEDVYRRFGDDFRRVFATYVGPADRHPEKNLPEGATWRTPFNVLRHGYAYGQPISHPLEGAELKDLINYPWPDPRWYSPRDIEKQVEPWQGEYAILGGEWAPFWHDAMDLVGMEELLIRMYTDPDFVEELFRRIVDFYAGVNEIIFNEASSIIDIHFMGNDLGSQNGPLIGPDLFGKFLLPHFRRLAEQSHGYGIKVMLHCCGGYEPLMDDLIKCGIDAFQALQPDAADMDPHILKKRYGDRVVLNGGVDSHYALIEGTVQSASAATAKAMETLMPGGNFILSPSHDYLLEETPVETVRAMYEAAEKLGYY